MKERRFTFGLRAVLGVVTVAALLAAVVSLQLRGRILSELEAQNEMFHMTLAPSLEVSGIPEFSNVVVRAIELLDVRIPRHGLTDSDIQMCEVVDPKNAQYRGVTYRFNRRGRQRFSIDKWQYTFDAHDPASLSFNNAVHEAINDAIVKCGVTVVRQQ